LIFNNATTLTAAKFDNELDTSLVKRNYMDDIKM